MARKLVIIGGGYLGAELARAMDSHADVVLVEPREAFCHAPVMIRAAARPDVADRAFFPYDRLLRRGTVLRARATALEDGAVSLDTGERLEADAIVVATGSTHGAAFRPVDGDVAGHRAASRALHDSIIAAERITVVGGGALGTELAGEIKAALPQKEVTLVSDAPLLDGYTPRLGEALARKLELLGVELRLGQPAEGLANSSEPFNGAVRLADGTAIASDLVIPALGARPATGLLDALPGVRKNAAGRVMTDSWMRPSDLPTVFAAGDAADNGDPMTIVATTRQVPWLARTLRGLFGNRALERMPRYTPWPRPPILVPLGPHLGNSILPVVGLVGNGPTRAIKGKELFVPKYARLFRSP